MSSMDKYKTREKAQVPSRVSLVDPTTGDMTEDWLEVRSSLSNEFIQAREDTMQAIQTMNEPNPDKRKEAVKELQLGLKVALVAGWSFDEPFTEEAVRNFLREAPQLQMMVTSVADDSARFFGKPSEPSSVGRKKK